jgi:hypothetical protein
MDEFFITDSPDTSVTDSPDTSVDFLGSAVTTPPDESFDLHFKPDQQNTSEPTVSNPDEMESFDLEDLDLEDLDLDLDLEENLQPYQQIDLGDLDQPVKNAVNQDDPVDLNNWGAIPPNLFDIFLAQNSLEAPSQDDLQQNTSEPIISNQRFQCPEDDQQEDFVQDISRLEKILEDGVLACLWNSRKKGYHQSLNSKELNEAFECQSSDETCRGYDRPLLFICSIMRHVKGPDDHVFRAVVKGTKTRNYKYKEDSDRQPEFVYFGVNKLIKLLAETPITDGGWKHPTDDYEITRRVQKMDLGNMTSIDKKLKMSRHYDSYCRYQVPSTATRDQDVYYDDKNTNEEIKLDDPTSLGNEGNLFLLQMNEDGETLEAVPFSVLFRGLSECRFHKPVVRNAIGVDPDTDEIIRGGEQTMKKQVSNSLAVKNLREETNRRATKRDQRRPDDTQEVIHKRQNLQKRHDTLPGNESKSNRYHNRISPLNTVSSKPKKLWGFEEFKRIMSLEDKDTWYTSFFTSKGLEQHVNWNTGITEENTDFAWLSDGPLNVCNHQKWAHKCLSRLVVVHRDLKKRNHIKMLYKRYERPERERAVLSKIFQHSKTIQYIKTFLSWTRPVPNNYILGVIPENAEFMVDPRKESGYEEMQAPQDFSEQSTINIGFYLGHVRSTKKLVPIFSLSQGRCFSNLKSVYQDLTTLTSLPSWPPENQHEIVNEKLGQCLLINDRNSRQRQGLLDSYIDNVINATKPAVHQRHLNNYYKVTERFLNKKANEQCLATFNKSKEILDNPNFNTFEQQCPQIEQEFKENKCGEEAINKTPQVARKSTTTHDDNEPVQFKTSIEKQKEKELQEETQRLEKLGKKLKKRALITQQQQIEYEDDDDDESEDDE